MSAYLQRETYTRLPAGVTEMFEPPEGAVLVDVEWDEEVVLVTWLRLPAATKEGTAEVGQGAIMHPEAVKQLREDESSSTS